MLNNEYKNSSLKIFSLKGGEVLAQEAVDQVGIELGKCSIKRFSDGGIQTNIEESIRSYDALIIQLTSCPMNLRLMEPLIMIDAYKRASAATINIVAPHHGCARQDRKTRSHEPIAVKLVVNLIETAGATRMIASDPHAPQTQGFFDIPIDHLMGVPILAKHFKDDPNINPEECVAVPLDHDGVTRARKLTDILRTPIVIIDERRPKSNVAEMMDIIDEIEGCTTIIIDDVIDIADIITLAAQTLKDKGAKEAYACCMHPALSGPAKERIESSAMKELIVTNSTHLDEGRKPSNTKELFVADLTTRIVIRAYERESASVLSD